MGIGKNLIKLRESKKLKQQEVADYIGVERKTYMSWETEKSGVSSEIIPKLAELFKVEINELFRNNVSEIVTIQNNTDNNDTSANCAIIILNDKEAINELVNGIIKKYGKSPYSFSAGHCE